MSDAVRTFELHVPDEALADLRDRLGRTRWPEPEAAGKSVGHTGWPQGPPLDYVRALASAWPDHDWRQLEDRLNAHGQSLAVVGGLDIHFLHIRSSRPDARPLVLTHGWPGSLVEPLEVMDVLANPPDPAMPAFHVVAPSLPGYGFGGKPASSGWNVDRTADAWVELMSRLGYFRFLAAGGDWGGRVTASLGRRYPDLVAGLHTFTPYVVDPPEPDGYGRLSPLERQWVAELQEFRRTGSGYSLQQSTRPQALAYALTDSPVGQLAWLLDKFWAWTDHGGDPAAAISRNRMLDTVSFYWLSATAGSSARFYWENFPPDDSGPVNVPSAVTVFPADIEKIPRPWAAHRFTDLRSYRMAGHGGHFPMLEVPALYVEELRHGFSLM
ncbi:epoxide hydrolase family protein [Arthrobacter sp. zg-Y750]|uniref:epoxide hydrolase family protein n=1 Tax=Arthrobacter sp. zg-Y750 TaxID=2894189 RepID=UPI001E3B78E9|nr:epoxide hydrolase family protein [Arthrobacter sp. zg-Y750]MCC9177432.1 epoxide hydrolase [Arthrobacter sp. zg-Y750]